MTLMHRMKQLFNIMPRVCQSAARIKPWTHPFTVQRAAMSPTRPLNKFSWCFQVLNSTSKYWNQSSLVASWKAKEVLGRTSCSENKVKGYYKGTLSFSLHYAIELIEAGKTSNLGHKKRVAKKMVLKFIQSLKQNYPHQEHENKHTSAQMSWQCHHKISDFLKFFFHIKNH